MTRFLTCLAAAALALAATGCIGPGGELIARPIEKPAELIQRFSDAYITSNQNGVFDAVAFDQPVQSDLEAGAPLMPLHTAPLRQTLHVHLYWRPAPGMRNIPTAMNAAIAWSVHGSDPRDPGPIVQYQGAGSVSLQPVGGLMQISIDEAQLTPTLRRPGAPDPMGACMIHGKLYARQSDERVAKAIEELRQPSTQPASR